MKIKKRLHMLSVFLLPLFFISVCSCGGSSDSGPGEYTPKRIFYVDSVSGNDDNDGRSENFAWKSIAKINSFPVQPGDAIKFKKGQVFKGGIKPANSGTLADPVIFDAYGTGDLPVLLGSRVVTGWTSVGDNIYSKTITCTPGHNGAGIVLENSSPMKFKEWKAGAIASLGAVENNVFTYDPADLFTATIYIRCTGAADPSTKNIEAGFDLFGIHGEGLSYIRINNLHFKNYSCHGVTMRSCNNITVRNCTVENIGGAILSLSPILYGGNGFEFTLNSSNCSIYDSTAKNIFDSGFSAQVFESNTTTGNVLFERCTAQKCGFAGIEISVLAYNSSSNEKLDSIRVVSCNVSDSGNGWSGIRYDSEGHGIRIKADTGAGTISGVSIEQTTTSGCKGSGVYIGGESGTVTINRSHISGNTAAGIKCEGIAGVNTLKLKLTSSLILDHSTGGSQGIGYNVKNGNGFEIINNTFCNNILGLYVGLCGGTEVLKNNIFYSSNSAHTYLYIAKDITLDQSDYNCYFEHGGIIIGWDLDAYTLVSDFSLAMSVDQNSIGLDPLFVDPASDFQLKTTSMSVSPCKNAGTPAGVSVDYEGNAYNAASPSMGAYQ